MIKNETHFDGSARATFRVASGMLLLFSMFLLVLNIGCRSDGPTTTASDPQLFGSDDQKALYGTPNKIRVAQVPDGQKIIRFGIVTDTHIDATTSDNNWWNSQTYGYNNSAYMDRNRRTVYQMNEQLHPNDCLGVVHIGDMIEQSPAQDQYATQQVIAFRQLYENDYPGRHAGVIKGTSEDYSKSFRVNVPVFPTVGNHDSPAPGSWHKPADYISERVKGAPGILSFYGRGSYIWRWGMYVFIQLGLWAGSNDVWNDPVRDSDVDLAKLTWLKEWLKNNVGDSNLGILIFQHYGFGCGEQWWKKAMETSELNVLCRREKETDLSNPYNIIGIFVGHQHNWGQDRVYAGKDSLGKDVYFDQYRFPDVGKDTDHQYFGYGYAVVWLKETQMTIDWRNGNNGKWSHIEKSIHTGR